MVFSQRLSLPHLIEMCRSLRHYLGAGISVRDAFGHQAEKGPPALRAIAGRIHAYLRRGHSLARALENEGAVPPLLISLVTVGEETGMLAEVFAELEKYYSRQLQLRRQFLGQIAWPVIQFFLAVLVIAGLIWFLGSVQRPGLSYDPLGLGLFGIRGSLTFLAVVFGTIGAIAGVFLILTRLLKQRAAVDRFLLRIPAIGPCLRSLALARFCLALRLTSETGMSIAQALRLSLRATGNEAFVAQTGTALASIEEGTDLTTTLTRMRLFPGDFLHIIAVGEESGKLTDVLRHQGEHYHEESGRRLKFLTSFGGFGLWALLGIVIIWAIFRMYLSYLGALGSF